MVFMKDKKNWTKWLSWFGLAVTVILIYKTIDNITQIKNGIADFLGVVMPFILGIIIAYILYKPCNAIEKLLKKVPILCKKSRVISVIIVYIITIICVVLVVNYIVPIICTSVIDFVNNFHNYYISIMNSINNMPDDAVVKKEIIITNIQKIGNINMGEYINIEKLSKYAQGALNIATGIFNFFVSIIVSAYILLERSEIIKFGKKFFSAVCEEDTYKRIKTYFNRANDIFLKFLVSQLLDAIVVGILTSIAMSILGVKYAVLLGVMIGLFNMIPYFGAIIAVIIATIITCITGGLSQAIWMLIITTILQQIDANIINPKIVGESLKISPLLVIFAVTIGGAYFNVLGMFLAVPIAAVAKVLICDFINFKQQQKSNE